MSKIKPKVMVVLVTMQVLFFNTQVFAEGGAVGDSKIAKGTEALIKDATTWLMILAPIIGGLLIIYFFIRRSGADEQDQKRWNNRIWTAIISVVGAVLGSAIINLIVGYYPDLRTVKRNYYPRFKLPLKKCRKKS